MMDKPTRPIEMGFALSSGLWNTTEIRIPADTPEEDIFRVAQDKLLRSLKGVTRGGIDVAGCWVHNTRDDDCPEVESQEVPKRGQVWAILSFDKDQTTVGTEIEQGEAALEQVNLTLQREPHGLGARLDKLTNLA